MNDRQCRRAARSVLSLLAGAAVFLSWGCGDGEPTSVAQGIAAQDGGVVSLGDDALVRIPPGALPRDTAITITRATEDHLAPAELEAARPLGSAFDIDFEGQELLKPVVLEVAYDPDLVPEGSPEEAIFLASYDEERDEWEPVYGTVDLDRHMIAVQTEHLSWWNPFGWDLSELWDRINRRIEGMLGSVGLPVADIPECGQSPRHMTVEFNDSLLACIESTEEEHQAVLKLANNRAYAVLIHVPPTAELRWASHGSLSDAAATFLEEKLGQGAVYVPPAGDAEFLLTFEGAGDIRLSSAPSDTTIALDMLLTILSMLGADPENVIDGMECLFEVMVPDTPEPRTAGDLLGLVKECVGVALEGGAGILWAAIRTFVTMGAAAGELVVDRTFGGDQGEVTVTYSPPGPEGPPLVTGQDGCPVRDEAFCLFVRDTALAMNSGDVDWLVSHSKRETWECGGPADVQFGPGCQRESPGTSVECFGVGVLYSESWCAGEEEYRRKLSGFVGASATVYAVAYPSMVGFLGHGEKGPAILAVREPDAGCVLLVDVAGGVWQVTRAVSCGEPGTGITLPARPDTVTPWPAGLHGDRSVFERLDAQRPAIIQNLSADGLHVRQQPGTESEMVGSLEDGDAVCLLGGLAEADGYWWWRLRAPGGKEGWAAAFDPNDPERLWVTPGFTSRGTDPCH